MHETKFKVWDERMVAGWRKDIAIDPDGNLWCVSDDSLLGKFRIHPDATQFIHILWYTGLHDKEGKRIHEGDILKYVRFGWRCPGHPQHNTDLVTYYKVIWDEEDCAFKADNKDMTGSLCFNDNRAERNEIEVIGNIYENPELMVEQA